MSQKSSTLRVISLVPSWTETLIRSGVEVVGRTRFCIHPHDQVKTIPIVGGTKQVNWQKIKTLSPDLIIVDKEENTLAIAEESTYPLLITHIRHINDVSKACAEFAEKFNNASCQFFAERWQKIHHTPSKIFSWDKLPGLLEWINPVTSAHLIEQVIYLIWREPWMCVNTNTFIGSILEKLSVPLPRFDLANAYPRIELEHFDPQKTLLLFSSEPYPFQRKVAELAQLPFASAVVDGECYSWFGVRSLKFLEEC